jgi:hypothetical protein
MTKIITGEYISFDLDNTLNEKISDIYTKLLSTIKSINTTILPDENGNTNLTYSDIGATNEEYVNTSLQSYLKLDGSVELSVGYIPPTEQSIATKKYVDEKSIDLTSVYLLDGTQTMEISYSPTLDTDLVTLKYFNDNSGGGGGDITNAYLLDGSHTMNASYTPTLDTDLVTLKYFNDNSGGGTSGGVTSVDGRTGAVTLSGDTIKMFEHGGSVGDTILKYIQELDSRDIRYKSDPTTYPTVDDAISYLLFNSVGGLSQGDIVEDSDRDGILLGITDGQTITDVAVKGFFIKNRFSELELSYDFRNPTYSNSGGLFLNTVGIGTVLLNSSGDGLLFQESSGNYNNYNIRKIKGKKGLMDWEIDFSTRRIIDNITDISDSNTIMLKKDLDAFEFSGIAPGATANFSGDQVYTLTGLVGGTATGNNEFLKFTNFQSIVTTFSGGTYPFLVEKNSFEKYFISKDQISFFTEDGGYFQIMTNNPMGHFIKGRIPGTLTYKLDFKDRTLTDDITDTSNPNTIVLQKDLVVARSNNTSDFESALRVYLNSQIGDIKLVVDSTKISLNSFTDGYFEYLNLNSQVINNVDYPELFNIYNTTLTPTGLPGTWFVKAKVLF